MKYIITSVLILFSVLCFGQEATTNSKDFFQEIYPFNPPFETPKIQFIEQEKAFFKKGKLKNLTLIGEYKKEVYDVKLSNKIIFKGEVKKRYSDGAFSFRNGNITFSNGDTYMGDFFEGKPVNGEYTFVNGDKVFISSYKLYDGPSSYSGMSVPCDYYFTLKNGVKYFIKSNQQFEYKTPDSTTIISKLSPENTLNEITYYKTKEGYEYKGQMSNNYPVGKWDITNQLGTFTVLFNLNTFSGFIPVKNQNGSVDWCKFENGKVIQKAKILAPNCYCISGDCFNGESSIFVNKEPELGLSFEMVGNFKNGIPVGDFTANGKDANGNKYTISGPIKNYKFHGKCTKAYLDYAIVFNGEYLNGLPQNGNLTVNDKLVEIKSFKDGKYIGKQTFTRSEKLFYSRYYEGEFNKYGQIEGTGTVYITDNNHWGFEGCKIYANNWKDGYSGSCCFIRKNGEEDCQRSYFVSSSDFPHYNFDHPISQRNQAEYHQQKEKERAAQDAENRIIQNEYQCNQCSGLGVIKTQCPMCHGAGYRKDMVTYDRHTGNTGGLAKCSHCAGTGQYTLMGCSKCEGKGFIKK